MRYTTVGAVAAALFYAGLSLVISPVLAGPIHDAAKAGDAGGVEALITAGADVDEKDAAFNTALHLAADDGLVAVVQVLLTHGTQVDAKDISDLTALQLAVFGDHVTVVKLLIAAGADVNAAAVSYG